MIEGSSELDVPVAVSGVTLPLAVAIFRATGPAMNFAVAIYVATWFGVPLSPATLLVGSVLAGCSTTGDDSGLAANDQPGQVAPVTDSAVSSDTLPPIGGADGKHGFYEYMETQTVYIEHG